MVVKAITFDFWCTLFRDANSEPRQKIRIQAFAEASGIAKDKVEEALRHVWGEFNRCHREDQRTLGPDDAVRMTADYLGITLAPEVSDRLSVVFATAILRHPPEPIEGALDAVKAASFRWPVGLISDSGVSPGTALRALLDRHGFTGCFDAMTFSDEVGVAKPQARMFETAAARLGVAPCEILHIGDLEHTDIAGIRGVGGKAALFRGANGHTPRETNADYILETWEDFLDLIPELT